MHIEHDDRKISQEHLESKCESIFEAIMIIGARAREIERNNKKEFDEIRRQINDDRKDHEYRREFYENDVERDSWRRNASSVCSRKNKFKDSKMKI